MWATPKRATLYKCINESNDYDRQREQHAKYKPTPKHNIAASTS